MIACWSCAVSDWCASVVVVVAVGIALSAMAKRNGSHATAKG